MRASTNALQGDQIRTLGDEIGIGSKTEICHVRVWTNDVEREEKKKKKEKGGIHEC